jgi:hypothetical protein
MPERPFVCVPTELNHHPLLLKHLRWDEHALFIQFCLETNRYWRVAVNPENLGFSLQCILFRSRDRVVTWSETKLVRWVYSCLACGALRLLDQEARSWLEVAEQFRYERGIDKGAEPARASQQNLPLSRDGPELFIVGPSHSNEKRIEEKRKESARVMAARSRYEELLRASQARGDA